MTSGRKGENAYLLYLYLFNYQSRYGRQLFLFLFLERKITRTVFCLADKNQTEVPTMSEKLQLLENGLGEKQISFPASANEVAVKSILFGYDMHVYSYYFYRETDWYLNAHEL